MKVRSTKSSIIPLASGVRSPAGTESSSVGIGDLVQHTRCTRGLIVSSSSNPSGVEIEVTYRYLARFRKANH